jgi:TolB-like protein
VDVGQFVTVGGPIATVYAVDVAEVGLALPDEELAYLDLPLAYRGDSNLRGPRVTLRTTFAGTRYEWNGRVVRTESEIDPVSRMVQVVAEVQNPYASGADPQRPPLAVGMYVEAEIEGRAFADIAVVPRAALRRRNQVLVIDSDNRVHFRDVEILRATTESVFLKGGLSAGELVAVSALDSPTEDMLVQVIDLDVDRIAEAVIPPARTAPDGNTEARTIDSTVADLTREPERPQWLRELLDDPLPHPRPEPVPQAPQAAMLPESAPLPTRAVVAVLPFEEINPGDRDADLGVDLTRAVTTRLEAMESLSVVTSPSAANLVVGGGVQQVGDVVRVTARVVEDGGDIVNSVKIDGSVSDLPRFRAELSAAIGDSIVDALDTAEPAAKIDRVTANPISVLPFANVSLRPGDVALAEAITTSVTNQLSMLSSVAIVTEERSALWIISGGVQRIGDTIRITATLLDRRSGAVVHAVKVDGPIDQLSRLQDEVAAELSNSVREATS